MEIGKIFTSNAVFPANKTVRIYGKGKGNIVADFTGYSISAIADSIGNWSVEFPPMEYGGPHQLKIKDDIEEIVLDNIHIGEVYIFAGQSNIELKVGETNYQAEKYIENAQLRLYTVDKIEYQDHYNSNDGWVICKKDEIERWSALAYMVGNKLSQRKDIAVGIIACYHGGSAIESWLPGGKIEKELGIKLKDEEKHRDHGDFWNIDGALYEKEFLSVAPYSVSGVVWYQGESDASKAEGLVYKDELKLLIDTWRSDLKDEKLPFTIVQIADYINAPDIEGWKLVQKAQSEIGEITKNVYVVKSSDVCEDDTIHPPTKDKLADRLCEALCGIKAI